MTAATAKGIRRDASKRIEHASDDWFTDAEIILEARLLGLRVVELRVVFLRRDDHGAVWEVLVNMALWPLGRHPAQRTGRKRGGARPSPPDRRSTGPSLRLDARPSFRADVDLA